ncbi:glycoside hydrolase family 79 protein [Mycena floridula]|nr:glycoside hydrolase family 79 protein [Mycena floridula]
MLPPILLWALSLVDISLAAITVYGQIPFALTVSGTSTASGATFTTLAAYNDSVLNAPAVPNPAPGTAFTLELPSSSANVVGLSIPLKGNFYGFSIEMSVATQVRISFLNVPFLNLMSNIVERAGDVRVRVGGNTQEFAAFAEVIPDNNGKSLGKEKTNSQNPTQTPAVEYTMDFFYMMSNISALTDVGWYLGIPFNDSSNFRLQIVEYSQAILGDKLLGLQAGNEPDLYAAHSLRPITYGPFDYFGEFGSLIAAINANNNIPVKNNLIGPSIATGDWTPQMIWDTGFIPSYSGSLSALSDNNCFATFGVGAFNDPQTVFPDYLNHTAGQLLVAPYLASSALAVAAGKPFLMFETNTASCGGFPGVSDSFGAALWALDYGLQMGYSNFSGAMLHVGGQNVFYNPFTAPPTNQSGFNEWTIGAIYYSTMIVAETLGKTGTAQLLDLQGNSGNIFTPQYAVWENGKLSKVALFNYITDPSKASDYVATIHLNDGSAIPSKVSVKYFTSGSVSTKDDIKWAGQTFGTKFTVDGRLKGDLNVVSINCDQNANTCQIPVPAPAFALVFMSDGIETPSPTTFATTAYTKLHNTATIDAQVLQTSNGHSGADRLSLGSTSVRSANGALRRHAISSSLALCSIAWTVIQFSWI